MNFFFNFSFDQSNDIVEVWRRRNTNAVRYTSRFSYSNHEYSLSVEVRSVVIPPPHLLQTMCSRACDCDLLGKESLQKTKGALKPMTSPLTRDTHQTNFDGMCL